MVRVDADEDHAGIDAEQRGSATQTADAYAGAGDEHDDRRRRLAVAYEPEQLVHVRTVEAFDAAQLVHRASRGQPTVDLDVRRHREGNRGGESGRNEDSGEP